MINPSSKYPDSYDTPGYWSDISISQVAEKNQYDSDIAAGKYSDAYNTVGDTNIFGWFADYFNAIENRIYALQVFLSDTLVVQHPDQDMYDSTEPTVFRDVNKERALAVDDVWVTNAI